MKKRSCVTLLTQLLLVRVVQVVGNRQLSSQPPSTCVLEVSVRGVKISVQDQCHSAHRVGPAAQNR